MKTLKLDEATLDVLQRADVEDGVLRLPGEQLSRELYLRVNKALSAIGGKWNRQLGGHVFEEPDWAVQLESMLQSGEATPKDKLGFFPTPPHLVDRLLDLAEISRGQRVLEPSAGHGAISTRLLDLAGPQNLYVVELQERHAAVLAEQGYRHLHIGDFMKAEFPCLFERVVMNPPFERYQDIEHVKRAFDLLAPGGRCVAVMSAGSINGEQSQHIRFKELLDEYGSFEENPDGSFKESGTNVATVTVVLERREQEPLGEREAVAR